MLLTLSLSRFRAQYYNMKPGESNMRSEIHDCLLPFDIISPNYIHFLQLFTFVISNSFVTFYKYLTFLQLVSTKGIHIAAWLSTLLSSLSTAYRAKVIQKLVQMIQTQSERDMP